MESITPVPFEQEDPILGEMLRQIVHREHPIVKRIYYAPISEQRHFYTLTNGTVVSGKLPNRNDPCPCGSGKKYKKCCLG